MLSATTDPSGSWAVLTAHILSPGLRICGCPVDVELETELRNETPLSSVRALSVWLPVRKINCGISSSAATMPGQYRIGDNYPTSSKPDSSVPF